METNKLISKFGAGIAVVCILFLPFVGCGGQDFSGLELLQDKEAWAELKLFIAASVLFGIAILLMKHYLHIAICAIGGIVSLIIAYLIAHSKSEGAFELKFGAFLAIIGYIVAAIASLLKINEKKE